MPDQLPEHRNDPPQWPPPSWHNEPTTRPQAAADEKNVTPGNRQSDPAGGETRSPSGSGFTGTASVKQASYGASAESAEPVAVETPAPEPEPKPEKVLAGPPPTHGRGVRMAIYGFGGAVAIALLVTIVVMAGGSIVPNLGGDDEPEPEPGYQLVTDDGKVDGEVYAKLADTVGTGDWVDWRYGAASDTVGSDAKADEPETANLDVGDGIDHVYQHGDNSAVTDMRNVQGQLGFVSDDPKHPGVDRVTTMEATSSSLGFAPRPGGRLSADAAEVELTEGSTADCLGDTELGNLVAMDRADGPGLAAQSVLAFSSGAIATTGISGAQGGTCVQLPDGLVPTSVSVSPANEFALVTTWDPEKVAGQVAVIALADTPGGYDASWASSFPGLPGAGYFGFAKLLGMVDLGVKAPTSISIGTDYSDSVGDVRSTADLTDPAIRDGYAGDIATAGFAVVASKAEKTVEWLDLTPMLSGLAKAYFKGDPGVYAKPGAGAKDWPPTFDTLPDYSPVVVGKTALDAEPGAVAAVGQTGYVADGSGKLAAFDVGDPAKPADAGAVDLPGSAIGLEPTSDGKQLLATSREARSVSWVKLGSSPSVGQTLQDARITDPISAEDCADPGGGGTSAHTVAIADYGSGSLLVFRYGAGALASGTDLSLEDGAFEFGGAYQPKGKPFTVSTTADNL